jgi:hypothetical protein
VLPTPLCRRSYSSSRSSPGVNRALLEPEDSTLLHRRSLPSHVASL